MTTPRLSRRLCLSTLALLIASLAIASPAVARPRDAFRFGTADARAVAGFDFAALKRSPHFKKVWAMAKGLLPRDGDAILTELKAEAGFDFRRHLLGLTQFGQRLGQGRRNGLLVVEAKYNEARLLAYARKKGMIAGKEKAADGRDIYLTNHDEIRAFALRGRFALLGGREQVLNALNPKKKRMTQKLRVAVRTVATDTMFAATTFDSKNPPPMSELDGAEAMRFGVQVKHDVHVRTELLMDNPEDAEKIALLIKLALSQAGLPHLKGIEITADKSVVRGRLHLERDEVDALLDLIPSQ